ncbi:hypothetical protein A0J48_007825 [Sphaerospermopsis aphanizomenoides BCCUSP55]|uniref:hypothetical protein n=1 Tax=Sphaerospermopsis aphanizomenoides TaxID=459663 RepID=UPI0019055064|nr:hypothetical protein [Sphaerospermopsis aphanizomenoides]MBK1987445.1 hypothetical protein [Sphaerospermopsis aphanizomenoides BCCUSP55]
MKHILVGIFAATSLLVSSGCSSTVKSGEAQISNHENVPKTEKQETKPMSDNHDGHSMEHKHHEEQPKTATQAKLTTPKNLTTNQPINLVIDIQDSAGKPVNNFDVFQEKIMHLIVVSNDLEHFDHLHPDYKENGRFEVSANFPQAGDYTLFSDYKPAGQKESLSLTKISIPGTVPLPKSLSKYEKTKTVSDTKVNFKASQEKIKAGEEVSLIFDLTDSQKQPIKDLQPYLGEKGHLVIIKSSSPLTTTDYIHAHAMKNTSDGKIEFHTKFPKSGTYKMWMQFNRNGNIRTADFWVNVE